MSDEGNTMEPFTPTTEQVRAAYVRASRQAFIAATSEHEDEFDRWLEQHDAEVAANALRDAGNDFARASGNGIEPVLNHAAARILHSRADKISKTPSVRERNLKAINAELNGPTIQEGVAELRRLRADDGPEFWAAVAPWTD